MSKKTAPAVPFTFIDRTIAVFSPEKARRRYSNRVALEMQKRLYDGAQGNRLTENWNSGRTAADSEIAVAGGPLRDRMRDLVRNNALAAQAVQVLVNNMVGPGIRPRAKSGNKARDKKVDKLWAEWSKRCDAHGHTDFHGVLALAVREMIEGGDVFAIRRRRRRQRGRVPLEIELYEADHLDDSRQVFSGPNARHIRQGIEYDESGKRSAYWMFREHPGDNTALWRGYPESVRVPAADVAHLFERQRVQSRGVPWGAPAMVALRDHGDWQLAEMVRKKTEACLVGVVMGEDGAGDSNVGPLVEDAQGNLVEQFRPGMIAYARDGKDIKFNSPSHAGGVSEWNRVQMHLISAGFRVPYALMTGDLSQANFSSNRAGLNEFRRMVDQMQWQIIIPMFCERIWEWFCEAAHLEGLIDTADIPVEWAPPKFESVNPKQDAETDQLEVRSGFASRSQMIAKRGYDPREIEEEIANDNAEADRLGLILDSDPRKVTRQGMSQERASGDRPGAGESDGDESSSPSGGNQED